MVLRNYGKVPLEYLQSPGAETSATVIFLHGAASSGLALKEKVIELLGNEAYIDHIKFVFPTAPTGYLSYLKKVTNLWFNTTVSKDFDWEDARSSVNYILSIYEEELKTGIKPSRIAVGGFSQGGSIAMAFAFTRATDIAGVFSISGIYDCKYQKANRVKFPRLFHTHGNCDYLMPYVQGKRGFEYLQSKGVQGEFLTYKGKLHEVDKQSLIDHYSFIKTILPPI